MAYLETKDLTVGYHGKPLIEDIALHVQRGRIVTLIGPNGSGKSTILKTIIGQLSKVSGTVFLDGKAMEARSRNEIARRMAILMTARMEPELMTCRDVVGTGRYPYTGRLGILQPEDQAIVERSLERPPLLRHQRWAAPADPAGAGAVSGAGDHRAGRAHQLSGHPLQAGAFDGAQAHGAGE